MVVGRPFTAEEEDYPLQACLWAMGVTARGAPLVLTARGAPRPTLGTQHTLTAPVKQPRGPASCRAPPHSRLTALPPNTTAPDAQVAAATKLWDGSGSFVFTSSMSVCAAEDGSEVNEENCPLVPEGRGPSTDRLLAAEAAALSAGGNVLRLVGLYHAQRGPHTFFIRQGEIARYGGYTVNMLHYEDAASLAAAILRGDGAPTGGAWRGRVFVGADNHPLTFQEMVDACFDSGAFSGSVKFTAPAPTNGVGLGKRVNNDITRRKLGGWAPKHNSFVDFYKTTKGQDFYTTSGLF